MKKLILIPLLLSSYILSGCTTQKETKKEQKKIDKTVLIKSNIDRNSKNYFGLLSDATVNIYELGQGDKKLLFSEKTSSGFTKAEIGNFDAHLSDLNKHKFYLYEVKGGVNFDFDKDGDIDQTATKNDKLFRTINRGSKTHLSWWKDKTKNQTKKTTIE